jgi:hypothetical protein
MSTLVPFVWSRCFCSTVLGAHQVAPGHSCFLVNLTKMNYYTSGMSGHQVSFVVDYFLVTAILTVCTTRNYLICDAFSVTFSENVTNVHCSPKHCDDFFNSSRFYDVFLFFVTNVHRSPKHYHDLLNSSRFYDVFLFSSQTLRRFI